MRYAWATREPARAAPFLAALAPLGLAALAAPLTGIVPAADLAPLDAALGALQPGDVVALASARAAALVASRLSSTHARARLAALAWWAVGESSAAPLRDLGLTVSVASRSSAVGLAEAVLASRSSSASALRVLLPRAEDGREEAALALRAAGARVDELVIYRSAPLPLETAELQAALTLVRDGAVPVLALFAPSQVAALTLALSSIACPLASSAALFAAIGETTARALTAAGAARVVVAAAPTPEAMANAVASRYSP